MHDNIHNIPCGPMVSYPIVVVDGSKTNGQNNNVAIQLVWIHNIYSIHVHRIRNDTHSVALGCPVWDDTIVLHKEHTE